MIETVGDRGDDDEDFVPRKQARMVSMPVESNTSTAAVACTPLYEMSALAQLAEESIQTEIAR